MSKHIDKLLGRFVPEPQRCKICGTDTRLTLYTHQDGGDSEHLCGGCMLWAAYELFKLEVIILGKKADNHRRWPRPL